MRVTGIETVEGAEGCRLQATVISAALSKPFQLWFDIPGPAPCPNAIARADMWAASLLLPAMRAGEPLHIDAPLSVVLADAIPHIQTIYATWLPSAVPVEFETSGSLVPTPGDVADGVGLFFSCGVDSWYSLLRSELRRAQGRPSVSHLLVVHGVDIDVGPWKADVADDLIGNVDHVARHLGLEAAAVSTNIRQLYTRTGLSWRWGQAGAIAAVGLALRHVCGTVVVAAGATVWSIVAQPEVEAGGCHPLLVPLFSTPDCELTVDGSDRSRLGKIHTVAGSPLALDTLRVCWASHEAAYNCGRCAKCVRTMLELEIAGALGRCSTLPSRLDPAVIDQVEVLFPREVGILRERHARLQAAGGGHEVLTALAASIDRAERHCAAMSRAIATVRGAIDPARRFVVLDDDEIRFELARTHTHPIPFTERDGLYNGLPADDAAARAELDRLRAGGAERLVVWKNCFWALDHYEAFADDLRARFPVVVSTPEILIFDLGGGLPA